MGRIMKEQLVSLEVAKLLKVRGFNEFCILAYADEAMYLLPLKTTNSSIDKVGVGYSAPTQSLAQRWLREKHNFHICIYNNAAGYGYEITKADNGTHIVNDLDTGPNAGGKWDTYEEALEEGLREALKLIKRGV